MEIIDVVKNILKFMFTNICVYLIFFKITNNYRKINLKNIVQIILLSSTFSTIYSIILLYIGNISLLPFLCFLYSVYLSYITKYRLTYSILVTIISVTISYIVYLISIIISSFIARLIFHIDNSANILILLLAMIIEIIILYKILNIKRLKNGFNFLKNVSKVEEFARIAFSFGAIVMLINVLLHYGNYSFKSYIINSMIIIAIILIIWIKSQITQKYKENMKNRTIEIQNQEILEQQNQINELKETNLKMATVIHKYNNRFNALENAIITSIENTKSETSSELGIMLEDLKQMSKQFSGEIIKNTKNKNTLPLTNIISIDNIFKYMSLEADKNNIKFDLKINNSINYLIEKIIKKEDLETLIGDHIKDAIIAINSSNNKSRKIMCILGIVDNCYELCIYDTGINFEIETLLKLGTKMITTHKNNGGSGIGFITTFDTLRKCKGSIIIEEYDSEENYYTKSITFRFDGKKEYKIRSYRVEQIKSNSHYANRIILEKV